MVEALIDDLGADERSLGPHHPTDRPTRRPPAIGDALRPGATTGVGSLPHRSVHDAVAFALREYDLPAIPSLPRRSPAEGLIAQAVVGIAGVRPGQYGSIAIDRTAIDPTAPIVCDLAGDAYTSLRTFLCTAVSSDLRGPVKWQFVGPVTLGVALSRAGIDAETAFSVAVRSVRAHLAAITDAVAAALPDSPQLVCLDEPWFGQLMHPGFPIAPDPAIDLLSSAMAAVQPMATVGVHCCAESVDIASLLAAGPEVLSIPVHGQLVAVSGYLLRFLESGGRIAWGVVPSDGPIPVACDRSWRRLRDVWCELVRRGADPTLLRRRSLLTAHCGLGSHTPAVADRVSQLLRGIRRRVNDPNGVSRYTPRA
jgi:hypothetical protein